MSERAAPQGEAILEVQSDCYRLDGRIVSDEAFADAVAGYASIRMILDPEVSYERIGKAIYTATRTGVLVNVENPTDQ